MLKRGVRLMGAQIVHQGAGERAASQCPFALSCSLLTGGMRKAGEFMYVWSLILYIAIHTSLRSEFVDLKQQSQQREYKAFYSQWSQC